MKTSNTFTEEEFQQCNPPCSLQDMNQSTLDRFDKARGIAGIPFIPTCGYRSPEWDRAKGRSGTGAHPNRHGIDLEATDSTTRCKIVTSLILAGFTRIGIADTFIHADDSPNHAQNVMWTY